MHGYKCQVKHVQSLISASLKLACPWGGLDIDICVGLGMYQFFSWLTNIDATLQNFIYKHTVDLENVQRNKKKEKGRIYRKSS
jgi:hypothetical protein